MKSKFEDNVASDIPKTRNANEPDLPWQVSADEVAEIGGGDAALKAAINASPPLKVRPVFLILLIVTIFVSTLCVVMDITIENATIQTDIMKKERVAAALKTDLDKTMFEKKVLSDNAVKLEKRVSDLNEQKEVYTAVIETLTKKGDEPAPNTEPKE